jgi:chemotaxis protein methyltransferase CheR
MSLNSIDFFSKFIERETGIVFHDINLYQLKTRLEEIVKFEKLGSIEEYALKFQNMTASSAQRQRLLDHATNNETLFFRDPTFFGAFEEYIRQEVLPSKPAEIKIWSAAASTGQEALSIAMVLDELSRKINLPPYSITATDISEKAIAKAKSGLYSDFEVMRGLSDERKQKYFSKAADGWHVKQNIHSRIKFGYNNLIRPQVTETFHLILCRNVLIYQKVEMKKNVVDGLYRQLEPNGAILLGVGETMLGIRDQVETSMIGNVIFYRKNKSALKGAA